MVKQQTVILERKTQDFIDSVNAQARYAGIERCDPIGLAKTVRCPQQLTGDLHDIHHPT
jgi:hypothetical protein